MNYQSSLQNETLIISIYCEYTFKVTTQTYDQRYQHTKKLQPRLLQQKYFFPSILHAMVITISLSICVMFYVKIHRHTLQYKTKADILGKCCCMGVTSGKKENNLQCSLQ